MSDSFWQADVKLSGVAGAVTWRDGEWSATGVPDGFIDELESRIEREAAGITLGVIPARGEVYARAVRSLAPVYGVEDRLDDEIPADAVI